MNVSKILGDLVCLKHVHEKTLSIFNIVYIQYSLYCLGSSSFSNLAGEPRLSGALLRRTI